MNKMPYNVLRHRDWDQAPRDPVSIGTAIAGALGVTSSVGVFLITAATYAGISLITSWALSALAPKPKFGDTTSRGILVNQKDPISPHDFVYGEVRKGGTVTYYETTGTDNKFLHQIIVLAGHEVDAIGDIYINDEVATLDANGFVTSGNWNSKIRVKKHLGTADQTTDADLLSESNQIDSNFRGRGIAYIYVRHEYDQDVFANGLPLITAVVRGKKVFDPRSSTTGYSANAALCVRDYITSTYGLNDDQIDEIDFAAAANICDENVSLSAGGTEKRYTINGVIQATQSHGDVLQSMMTACAGSLFWGAGKWKLKVGDYVAPAKTLTLDDLRGPISLSTRVNLQDQFNGVKGTFNDAAERWITTEYPSITSATFEAEDGGEQTMLDLALPFTTSAATAQRLAKLTLFRGREQMTLTADFGLNSFDVEVGEIIALTNPRYGWTAKEFEVVGWAFGSGDAGDLRVTLTLRETSETAFDWDAEETAIISNNTALPSFTSVAAVTNLQLTGTSVLNDDGISVPAIRATWTASTNAFVQYYEIQYKRLGGEEDYGSVADAQDDQEDWGSITVAYTSEEDYGLTNEPILSPDAEYVSSFGSSTAFLIQPVLNGYDYNVRVRAVNSLGVRSPWATSTLASVGDTTPPNAPLSLTAVGNYKSITLSWLNPADQDLDFVEIWQNTINNLASATLVGVVRGTNFTVPGLPNNTTRFYWVRAVDYSLNKSEFSTGASATTLLIEPNDFSDAVNDLFQEAGAFGVEPVSELPASGDFDGQLVLLLPEITIYRWDEATSSWSTDIFTASSVEAGSITYASFASGIEPVGVVDTLPTVAGYEGPQVVVLTTDGKLYRLVDGVWTAAVNTDDIEGQIGANLFSDDLRPIERVASLPITNLTQGRVVLLTTDNKLYRYTGSAWTAAVPTSDLTGQINGTQIADAAVTASKIGSAAVTTAKIANNAVTADIIAANAVTETKITDNAITSPKITASAITAGKIATNAITSDKITANAITAGKLDTGAVTADKISAGAVTAGKIAANAVTATEIAAGSIVSDKIASNAITAAKIEAGAVSADKIAANAVTATKIAADAVVAGKIAANAVDADAITANAVTTGKIAAGAVNATQIAANAITSDKIFANAVTSAKIATGSIIADKIAAGAIITSKIATGAVTADKITVSELSAISGSLGTIQVGTANIANSAITSAKIGDAQITNAKIANLSVNTIKVADRAITSQTSVEVASASTTNTSFTTLASLSFSAASAGEQVLIGASFIFDVNTGSESERTGFYRVLFNGSVVFDGSQNAVGGGQESSVTRVMSKTSASGTNTLVLQGRVSAGETTAIASDIALFTLEALK